MKKTIILAATLASLCAAPTVTIVTNITTIPARTITNRTLVVVENGQTNKINMDQLERQRPQQATPVRTNQPVRTNGPSIGK